MSEEKAECRGCGMILNGKPYHLGGPAYHPKTGERAKVNHYGGYVCSERCDYNSSLRLEQDMPGHGPSQKYLGCFSSQSYKNNWGIK